MNAQTATKQAVTEVASLPPRNGGLMVVPHDGPRIYPPKLAKAIATLKREVQPVAKDGEVAFGRGDSRTVQYRYPKSEDVLDEVIPLTTRYGIIITQSEVKQVLFESERMLAITYEYTILNEDGEVWPDRIQRTGMAWVRDKNGNVDDKASNKCSTQSEKYFYIKFFNIRTSDAAQIDNDAQVPGQVEDTTPAKPKPPKPGSEEAKALDEPHLIDPKGMNATSWSDAFIAATEHATPADIAKWVELNKPVLDKLGSGQYAADLARVQKHIEAKKGAAAPKPPKPPKPEVQAAEANPMPDPAKDAQGWLAWLTAKFKNFTDIDTGSNYWDSTVLPLLDGLPHEVCDEAMAVWQRFEEKHAP